MNKFFSATLTSKYLVIRKKQKRKNELFNLLYTAGMKPGLTEIRNNSTKIIARELLYRPHAIVATINTLVSSFSEKLKSW
jgi:hypothetical protein